MKQEAAEILPEIDPVALVILFWSFRALSHPKVINLSILNSIQPMRSRNLIPQKEHD